ncbi:polyribonucleotide nucleotidyltransferase [Candidatus Peregrinibacteria bacterium]|jgi:polyribonucleotide nucleotidyltransferase|nr:polyribonucleotide nucleotidyltransferase [Candidatus Peregrinibacteria bacterium]MBT4148734.1 polyribonucleotide nucleotidyltransferase [Candidatus Peregrinibacteria bacterium]MBT4366164.1 polyribonucleotide nucleotidyltransferase [Candidatus Peregrinibacteria bacterium]MBT4456267.1 polyribonucleotide nucleotidyltransferase [Candidatus Peregrinibacteria bacterium]
MEPKSFSCDLAGRKFELKLHPITTQATGYIIASLGDTVIMANTSVSEKGKEGFNYFPMSVDYEENMYAAGKIKGSRFVKREGRPSENAILTARLIDRPLRPLFPKGTRNEVQIICSVLSADLEVDPGTSAINAASAALLLTGAPFEGPVGAVRMGYVDDKLVINPTYQQCEEGKLNLVVAGTEDAITMVEAAVKEVSEEVILEALQIAHEEVKKLCQLQKDFAEEFKKNNEVKDITLELSLPSEEAATAVDSVLTDDMLDSIKGVLKKEVKENLHKVEETVLEKFAAEIEEDKFSEGELKEIILNKFEKRMRQNILEKGERIDGRKPDDVRDLHSEVGVLPRTHGTGLFNRGETQVLTITTLGGPQDAQIVDTMEKDSEKGYFHHYKFPPYAVGDIKMLRGASRRDIGHGDLAERALIPVLPGKDKFPYTMWLVSEVTSCNGSSSMASVCGSTLSLMDAGVPITRPVSGVAMGLVVDKDKFNGGATEDGSYTILTDIQGAEDFAGDMDFKITGTTEGVTALQMDIKVKGLSIELMKRALTRAKEARQEILDSMLKAIPASREKLSAYAPLIMNLTVDTDDIRVVIGKGGETIQAISKECEVEVNIDDDGIVTITAPDQEKGQKAVDWIEQLVYKPKVGDIIDGKVVKIMDFGAFVELSPGKDGLVHISKLSKDRVNNVEDVVKMGDTLKVKLVEIDSQGRYNLTSMAALEGGNPAAPAPKQEPKEEA